MAFFKFRWPGQKEQGGKAQKAARPSRVESIEVMRRRARHRLIGAAMLVLLGVVGFPILFDTQPRPIPVDIPIEIPDRNKVAPLVVPAPEHPVAAVVPPVAGPSAARAPERPAQPAASVAAGTPSQESRKSVSVPEPAASAAVAAKPRPDGKSESKPVPAPAAETRATQNEEAARARALLEGRAVPSAPIAAPSLPENGRFIVQIGAFAEVEKAREVRLKLERAGIKTYAQVVETKDGKRIRVRVGPFDGKAEAEKAAARIKGLNLPVSILLL